MKTTATNRRIRELLTQLRKGTLEPRPEFQRRLVWSNKDKCAFLETVLLSYPFPEIYVAAGEVDVETGDAKEMLVDGQQRITTLNQYFTNSPELKLAKNISPYSALTNEQKERFLQYEVVVRDMGKVEMEQIKEVFRRINATRYSLNAMEIHNARYEGELKSVAEALAENSFFDTHRIFSSTEIKRMQDTRFLLVVIITVLEAYFNRDDEVEEWLKRYNDEFSHGSDVKREIEMVLSFIDRMNMPENSRVWKKADLFTLLVETHRALCRDQLKISPEQASSKLLEFYNKVDNYTDTEKSDENLVRYHKAALAASNDRGSRIARGDVIKLVLKDASEQLSLSR